MKTSISPFFVFFTFLCSFAFSHNPTLVYFFCALSSSTSLSSSIFLLQFHFLPPLPPTLLLYHFSLFSISFGQAWVLSSKHLRASLRYFSLLVCYSVYVYLSPECPRTPLMPLSIQVYVCECCIRCLPLGFTKEYKCLSCSSWSIYLQNY